SSIEGDQDRTGNATAYSIEFFKSVLWRHRGDVREHLRSKLAQRSRGTALLGMGLGPLVETYGDAVPGVHRRNRVGDVGDLLVCRNGAPAAHTLGPAHESVPRGSGPPPIPARLFPPA